ncbi:hypothetical protein TDB9533_01747 [Thalassocella blandensis]|nr:hypothetical protein TDB9533_01747 [Thalassocella blandensis]
MKNTKANNNFIKSIVLASTVVFASGISAVSQAEQESQNEIFDLTADFGFEMPLAQEEMTVIFSQQQLFDTEAYKAYVSEIILNSAKQLIRDIAVSPNYLAAK